MKTSFQFTPALTAGILCSLAWFALWLTLFHPAAPPSFSSPHLPPLSLHPASEAALRTLQEPTLFARPSELGFSGTFPDRRANVPLTLEQPQQDKLWLARSPAAAPAPDRNQLTIETLPLPQHELPAPGTVHTSRIRNPDRIELFFSPVLQTRVQETGPLKELGDLPASALRVYLTVRSDGTVAHSFFDDPVQQPALLSAVRRLRFSPAKDTADGWLDIRFTATEGSAGQ